MKESTRAVTHDCVQKYTPKYIHTLSSSMARVCVCVFGWKWKFRCWQRLVLFTISQQQASKGVLLSPNDVTENISHKIASFISSHKNSWWSSYRRCFMFMCGGFMVYRPHKASSRFFSLLFAIIYTYIHVYSVERSQMKSINPRKKRKREMRRQKEKREEKWISVVWDFACRAWWWWWWHSSLCGMRDRLYVLKLYRTRHNISSFFLSLSPRLY